MIKNEYIKEDIAVVWQPDLCIHAGNCFRSLPEVFKPRERPWIQTEAASKDTIIQAVNKCPSGALTIKNMTTMNMPETPAVNMPETPAEAQLHQVTVIPNGPLRIKHPCHVQLANGEIVEKPNGVSLCRCGLSANKPFCDGAHKTNGFTG